ncbi:MAG: hypothetical protein AABX07_03060 [Nanoarchaeota archaeon]
MGWKDWSYWLKGGSIFSVIYIICLIIFLSLVYNEDSAGIINIPFPFIGILLLKFISLVGLIAIFPAIVFVIFAGLFDNTLYVLIGGILNVFIYFVWGAIAGIIYGKIKNKKAESNSTTN